MAPNNSIRYIYQDSKGFLRLATLNGLSRYDGNSFLTFRPEAGDSVFGRQPDLRFSLYIKMAFGGFPLHLNYIVAMICNVPVLLITRVAVSWRRITLLYLLQPTETYGYHIKVMVADVWHQKR